MPSPDPKAIKILFDRYWFRQRWRDESLRITPPADFQYAKSAGVMFDDVAMSHDDIVAQAIAALRGVRRQEVADAFVSSLTTRRLDLRSALRSFVVLQHFPEHSWNGHEYCPICGEYDRPNEMEDLNVLNFERFKWGGVRLESPLYAGFDLKRFREAEGCMPTDDDVALLKGIIAAIERVPDGAIPEDLHKALPKALPSNMCERNALLGVLGYCGIFRREFFPKGAGTTYFDRWSRLPDQQSVETAGSVGPCSESDAVNAKALRHWFGHLL